MNGQKHILILGAAPLCRNPRVVKEAETLGRNGYRVTVITAALREEFMALDSRISHGAPFAAIPLDYLGGPARFLDRLRVRIAREYIRRSGRETPWALGPASRLLRIAKKNPADLTIVHNELPFWAGTRLLAAGRVVAADFEDWYSKNLDAEARSVRPLRSLEKWERSLAANAAFFTAPSQAMAAALQREYGGPAPIVLNNSFPLEPLPGEADDPAPPRLVWFSQTIGPGRGLEEFLPVWGKSARRAQLVLIGVSRQSFKEELLQLVPKERRADIEFRDLVPPWELHECLAGHDIGLALESRKPASRDLTITNKILQYFNAGLAIIASHTSGQDEVARNAPDAVAQFSNAEELTSILDRWTGERDTLQAARRAARKVAEERYCWEKEEPKLLEAVERAMG